MLIVDKRMDVNDDYYYDVWAEDDRPGIDYNAKPVRF